MRSILLEQTVHLKILSTQDEPQPAQKQALARAAISGPARRREN
jgi:hypothetical protein